MNAEHRDILETAKEMAKRGTLLGCFEDFPIEAYHHEECPGDSSTLIKRVASRSYNHWVYNKISSMRALEFGDAFHCYTMEPHLFDSRFKIVSTDSRQASEWKKAVATESTRTLLDLRDFECLKIMSKKLSQHPDIAPYWKGARFELTFFWICPITGLLLKCRTDILSGGIIFDLKSCLDASEQAFTWDMKDRLQRISSAHYLNGVSTVFETRHDVFRLVACEKIEPHEIQVHQVHAFSIEKAQPEIITALETIKRIREQGESAWRGYTLGTREVLI